MTTVAPTRTALDCELAEIEDRLRDARSELAEARENAQQEFQRTVLDHDGEGLVAARATVAWMLDEVAGLEHSREVLLHRMKEPT